jgi:hypothetical protein
MVTTHNKLGIFQVRFTFLDATDDGKGLAFGWRIVPFRGCAVSTPVTQRTIDAALLHLYQLET